MNLSQIAAVNVAAINPWTIASYGASNGFVDNGDFTQTPTYTWFSNIAIQVQPLGANDIDHVEGLNLTKNNQAVYMNGDIDGLDRKGGQGGDLLRFSDGVWLVTGVIEPWDTTGWTKIAVTLQVDP